MKHQFAVTVFALFAGCSGLAEAKMLKQKELVQALQSGGYVIYFRHFETGADYNDQHLVELGKCSTQRQLNANGATQAIRVRDAFVKINIPVGEVLASPFCRAWQSADLAFGRHKQVDGLKLPPSKVYTEQDKSIMKSELLPLINNAPQKDVNTIIMAHDDNLPAAGGPEIKVQGEAVILKPLGNGKFDVVAEILPGQWTSLAKIAR